MRLLLVLCLALCAISCSKDDDKFDYPMDTIYGSWEGVAIKSDGKWIDITEYPYTKFEFSVKFNPDGTYYGKGYFGTGSGTYKAEGSTIHTYVDGKDYAQYHIKSLSDNLAELTMTVEGESIDIRVQKKK